MKVKDILKNNSIWMPSADYSTAKPLVSVLLPTWKRAKNGLFEDAVYSVLSQTLDELELIIVDDCSTDGTFDIIQRIMKEDSRVSCIRHTQNIGLPAISEFEAFQKARGTYISFMFDDNEWETNAMEKLFAFAKKNKVKAVAGQYMLFAGRPGDSYDNPANWKVLGGSHVSVCDLMIGNCFGNGSVLLHRDTIEKVGFLDPNLALSRCWDWDLWQRISKEFRFEMVDIMVGREKGTGLEDSLGNTHRLYQWAAQERMHQPRNEELLPKDYLECEVFDVHFPSSPFLFRSNLWLTGQYKKKAWYDINDISLMELSRKSSEPWKGRRIVYLTASPRVNASSTLNWGRIPFSKEYCIFYSCIHFYDYSNWVLADAIVIERDLSSAIDPILDWAKKIGIPCYYYTDDNFLALAKDYENTYLSDNMNALARGTTSASLRRFKGMFCSTEPLAEFFRSKKLHSNVMLMEPVCDETYFQPYHALRDPINIVFFGSFIRGETLIEIVFEAIERISQTHAVQLYCPDETFTALVGHLIENAGETALEESEKRYKKERIETFSANENLTIVSFQRTLSLELALKRLEPENIQIQIHCGPIISNDKYKTVNALLNAVCLGAVLVATDDEPYSAIQKAEEEKVCLLAENTPDAWEKVLRTAIDPKRHKTMYENAREYCRTEFAATKAQKSLDDVLKEIEPYDFIDLSRRLFDQLQITNQVLGTMTGLNSISTSNPIQGEMTSALFLNSLSGHRLVKTLRNMLPGWKPGGRGIEKLLPLRLSKPIVPGMYLESKLPHSDRIRLVVIATEQTPVLFEFVSANSIIQQSSFIVCGLCCLTLNVPKAGAPIRLRIANQHNQKGVYVLQREIGNKYTYDIMTEWER